METDPSLKYQVAMSSRTVSAFISCTRTLVTLSVAERPVSLASSRSGVPGGGVIDTEKVPRVAAGRKDKLVAFYDPSTGKREATWDWHDDEVISVAWSPQGTQLVTGGLLISLKKSARCEATHTGASRTAFMKPPRTTTAL